jgi:hypothetical protein
VCRRKKYRQQQYTQLLRSVFRCRHPHLFRRIKSQTPSRTEITILFGLTEASDHPSAFDSSFPIEVIEAAKLQWNSTCLRRASKDARSDRGCPRNLRLGEALHKKSLHIDFSVQPQCSLCLGGVFLLGIRQPQRHREHRGCTEKRAFVTFCAKPLGDRSHRKRILVYHYQALTFRPERGLRYHCCSSIER